MGLGEFQRVEGCEPQQGGGTESPGRSACRRHEVAVHVERIAIDALALGQADLGLLVFRGEGEDVLESLSPRDTVAVRELQPGQPVQRVGIVGIGCQESLVDCTRLVEAVLPAVDARQPQQGRPVVGIARQHSVVDLGGLAGVLLFEREGEFECRVGRRRVKFVRFLQVADCTFAVAGVARHHAQEHVDARVACACGHAGLQQRLDRGVRARLHAEQALRLVDLAGGLSPGLRDRAGQQGTTGRQQQRHA